MVGHPYDCLGNPLNAVRLSFEKAISSGSDPVIFNLKDWGIIDLFHQLLNEDAVSKVPILDVENIRLIQPNTLVRFRGMIQDMFGKEFYLGAYKDGSIWRTNKFTDISPSPIDSSSEKLIWERQLFYCSPIPGHNKWIQYGSEYTVNKLMDCCASQHREKRQREDNAALEDIDILVSEQQSQMCTNSKKMRESDLSLHSDMALAKKLSIAEDSSLSCLVKVYDSPESDFRLNDIFEFIGIYTFDPVLMLEKDDPGEFLEVLCDDVRILPPSKLPRLHCIVHRKLANRDFVCGSPTVEPKPRVLKDIRGGLLVHLTAVLGNDEIAANFMLLHLLSGVGARDVDVTAGKFSLNLTCLPKESASVLIKHLSLALENLLPFTQNIPLTVDYLNSSSLGPRKDYDTNRLCSGVLQLADGSHLTIDETNLEAGLLNSVGVENARLLKLLTEMQKVEYDYTYYKIEMGADVQLLVVSYAKSNILPADVVLPFHPSLPPSSGATSTEDVEAWRWYLATRRSLPISIDSEMQKVVENDLVAARSADPRLGPQDLSRLVTMGCLMSASFGGTSLLMEHWEMAKELERVRKQRLCP